jgi:hypothetical protein
VSGEGVSFLLQQSVRSGRLLSRGLRVSPEIDVIALSLQAAMVRRGLEMRSGYESGGGIQNIRCATARSRRDRSERGEREAEASVVWKVADKDRQGQIR